LLSIKTKIKLKQIRRKLVSIWYFLMKPIEYIINKVEKYKYKRKEYRINKLTDERAIKLFSKILIKQLIKYKDSCEEFVVAEWCDSDYFCLCTIVDYIKEQSYNKDLRSWAYNLPWYDVDRIEKLTELLRLELDKYKEIECEYIVEDNMYAYKARNYKKTLMVRLNVTD